MEMDERIRAILNRHFDSHASPDSLMDPIRIEKVRRFHASFPQYAPTPLVSLPAMAESLHLGSISIKDESKRFGLNAFKVLGGSYAMAKCAEERIAAGEELLYPDIIGEATRKALGDIIFYTATDGNHGRGVAWSARQIGQKAVIHMPKGTDRARLEAIRREGAVVTIENCNYDACVRMAAAEAEESGGILLQDTAFPGYTKIPAWIMQGYGTMAAEAAEQAAHRPTVIFIQAGVGSLAGAIVGYFAKRYADHPPKFVVMEPHAANCHFLSAQDEQGAIRTVDGDMDTLMAGLACGEPNPISWAILKQHSTAFVSCPDWVSALGMRLSAAPMGGDRPILSGESGAVGLGLLYALQNGMAEELKAVLPLGEEDHVLLFSTEGNTAPERYRRIVWGGAVPVPEMNRL